MREALLQLEQEGLVCCGVIAAPWSRACRGRTWKRSTACAWRSKRLAVARAAQYGTEADFGVMDAVLHEFRGTGSDQPLTEQQAADQDVRFHDAVYRAAHHDRLYATWSGIRSQVYVLLLGRNVAGSRFSRRYLPWASRAGLYDPRP